MLMLTILGPDSMEANKGLGPLDICSI